MRTAPRRTSTARVVLSALAVALCVGGCAGNRAPAQAPGDASVPATPSNTVDDTSTTYSVPPDGVYSTEETIDTSFPALPRAAEDRFLVILQETTNATAYRVENRVRDVPVSLETGGASILSLGREYCFRRKAGMESLRWLEMYAARAKGRGDYEAVLIAYATSVAAVEPGSLCPETAEGVDLDDGEMIAVVEEAWEWPNNTKR